MRHGGFGNARHFGDNTLDFAFINVRQPLCRLLYPLRRTRFVNNINRLVGQETFVDVFRRQFRRRLKRIVAVLHAVVLLEHRAQALQNLHRFRHAGLSNVDFLETAAQCVVFAENSAVFFISGRADAAQLPFGQRRFEQVARVHSAALRAACADNRVDFIDKQHRIGHGSQFFQHGFEPRFKIAPIFRSGQQRAHIQRKHGGIGQHFRHFALLD